MKSLYKFIQLKDIYESIIQGGEWRSDSKIEFGLVSSQECI